MRQHGAIQYLRQWIFFQEIQKVSWKLQFSNIIVAKGYEDLTKLDWVLAHKTTTKHQQMSAWAMNKL